MTDESIAFWRDVLGFELWEQLELLGPAVHAQHYGTGSSHDVVQRDAIDLGQLVRECSDSAPPFHAAGKQLPQRARGNVHVVLLVDIRKQRSAVVFPTEGGWVWLSARTEFCCVSSAFPQPDAGRVFVDRCVEQSEESRHELTTVVHALFDKCAGRELRGVSQAPTRLRRCTVHGAQRVAVKHRHANR